MNALNEEDLKEWITALQSVAFRDKGGGTLNRNTVIEEHNDLYCSSFGDGLFSIKLIPSETTIRCNLEPKTYILHLTATELQLKSSEDLSIIVAKWPYRYIRKYGYRNGNFTFEAGRKCDTGEGEFMLDHTNPREIFRCMSSKMKSMKKLISGESLNSLDCGENQLCAALSMEAGSRSPLPPSPNPLTHNDLDSTSASLNQSCSSIREFLSSNDSLNNVSSSSSVSLPIVKHIPAKPPRKDLKPLQQQSNDKSQKYEPVSITSDSSKSLGSVVVLNTPQNSSKSTVDPNLIANACTNKPPNLPNRNDKSKKLNGSADYESIETITDAWKTLGISEVKHTEHINPDDDLKEFAWQRTQSQRGETSHNITLIDENDANQYDRLDFMPPNSKGTSNQYKSIVRIAQPEYKKQNSAPPVPNDYELIENPDMQPCRLADDSYLGYGVLRKSSIPGPQVPTNTIVTTTTTKSISTTMITEDLPLDHRSYNGLKYAIVSRPKRV